MWRTKKNVMHKKECDAQKKNVTHKKVTHKNNVTHKKECDEGDV